MLRITPWAAAFAVLLLLAPAASACPVCASETGQQVKAGIFNDHFGHKLILTVLPFPVFLGLVAAIHFGFPFWMARTPRAPLSAGAAEGLGPNAEERS